VTERQFSSEQCAWLGLDENEAVRVLASGSRTILLERTGAPAAAAFPWDRELVLFAQVAAFALADVLHLLHSSAKSGFLFFEDGDHVKSVYLHRGEVVFAASNQTVDRLGECLLRLGVITPEQYREAARLYSPQARYGKILVERGFLSPRELWEGVKLQVEEIVRSLFSHGSGTVLFWEGEVRPDNVVRLSLPTRRLIADGLRRRDELLSFLAWLEDPRVRFEPLSGDRLSGTERTVYEALEQEETFAGVCHRAGVDPLSGARAIHHLRLLGSVQIERDEEAAAGPAEADVRPDTGETLRETVWLYVKLLAELAAPIVAMEGGDGVQERVQRVVDEASRRFPEILSGLCVGSGASVDPELLIERALRFPGEREREVRLALGELVSYLEFELLNHPKIADPESFLEGLEELRAQL
jgi:hypothetical protein